MSGADFGRDDRRPFDPPNRSLATPAAVGGEGGGKAGHKVIQRDGGGAGGESEVCESSNGKADSVRE